MKFRILKSQGSGNDFFLIDIRGYNGTINRKMKISMAVTLCDRQTEYGADGILFVENSPVADGKMIIFNADGSEAEMCGNGIRIVARYIAEDLGKTEVTIENTTGIIYHLHNVSDFFDGVDAYQLEFPQANFKAELVPIKVNSDELKNGLIPSLSDTLKFTAISLPNPHIVAYVDHIDENALKVLGLRANSSPDILPNGVNVNLGKVLDKSTVYVATYERGVGITYSCGTGMFATAITAVNNGYAGFGEWITLFNKGGYTKCMINQDFSGKMIGNASYIYDAEIDFDFDTAGVTRISGGDYDGEVNAYGKLLAYIGEQHVS